ncbi:MAG: hypothetical protein V3T77_03280 [Planctomycetota bacterium]
MSSPEPGPRHTGLIQGLESLQNLTRAFLQWLSELCQVLRLDRVVQHLGWLRFDASEISQLPLRKRVLLQSGFILGCITTLLHLALKDRIGILAPLYYLFSPALMAVGFGSLGYMLKRLGLAHTARQHFYLAGVAAMALVFGFGSFRLPSTEAIDTGKRETVRVMVWNMFRGNLGRGRAIHGVQKLEPDVAAIFDPVPLDEELKLWGKKLPKYRLIRIGKEAILVTRGRPKYLKVREITPGVTLATCQLRSKKSTFYVSVVVFSVNPFRSRSETFEKLAEIWEKLDPRIPHVVLGAFNIPRSSAYFKRMTLRNAYEVGGRGFGLTWPMPLPLYDPEQIWVNNSWKVISCKTYFTTRSDHTPLVATLQSKQRR